MAALLRPPVMFERAINAFWILLGAAAAAYAWTLGLIGASGPESGLFPFLAGLIIMGAGVVLLLWPLSANIAPDFPRGDALWRVLGVIAGLAFMAVSIPFLGFAVAGFITMVILLRTVDKSSGGSRSRLPWLPSWSWIGYSVTYWAWRCREVRGAGEAWRPSGGCSPVSASS